MNIFMFLFLVGYAVKCDESSYYVVQMPETVQRATQPREFNVYWNVPTFQCGSKKIPFTDLQEKYGIIQNSGDAFRGDRIAILYDPGEFPALLKNTSSGEIKKRNGGVPQEGDLIKHLKSFQDFVEKSIPDSNFKGVAIIDFESWRPIFRQNFGSLIPYKTESIDIERKRHWWWKKEWIEEEAKHRFEEAGRDFMQATIALAKKIRPQALWGYYAYPYCFNMAANKVERCADNVDQENNQIKWLWKESTALFPSVYSSDTLSTAQLAMLIRGRVKEALRVRVGTAPVLPYFWFRYRDGDYLTETDLETALKTFYKGNASGFIIWGSSNDVSSVEKCQKFRNYVDNVLGPAIAKYTKLARYDDDLEVNNENNIQSPEDDKKPSNESKEDEDKDMKESILIDLILHEITSDCVNGCHNDTNVNETPVVLTTEDPFNKSTTERVTEPSSSTPKPQAVENNYDYYDLTIEEEILKENIINSMSMENNTTKKFNNTLINFDKQKNNTINIGLENTINEDFTSQKEYISTMRNNSNNNLSDNQIIPNIFSIEISNSSSTNNNNKSTIINELNKEESSTVKMNLSNNLGEYNSSDVITLNITNSLSTSTISYLSTEEIATSTTTDNDVGKSDENNMYLDNKVMETTTISNINEEFSSTTLRSISAKINSNKESGFTNKFDDVPTSTIINLIVKESSTFSSINSEYVEVSNAYTKNKLISTVALTKLDLTSSSATTDLNQEVTRIKLNHINTEETSTELNNKNSYTNVENFSTIEDVTTEDSDKFNLNTEQFITTESSTEALLVNSNEYIFNTIRLYVDDSESTSRNDEIDSTINNTEELIRDENVSSNINTEITFTKDVTTEATITTTSKEIITLISEESSSNIEESDGFYTNPSYTEDYESTQTSATLNDLSIEVNTSEPDVTESKTYNEVNGTLLTTESSFLTDQVVVSVL